MGRNGWIAGLALCMALMGWEPVEARMPAQSTVRVVLTTDVAGLTGPTLERAKDEAVRLFERSQIDLVWIDAHACDARCLYVRIVTTPIGVATRNQFVLGTAPESPDARGKFAFVFYGRIRAFSAELRMDAAQMLGHVIAHELGHLLLPHGAHSAAGLMRVEWDRAQVNGAVAGRLTFTSDQAALILERLTASASPIADAR